MRLIDADALMRDLLSYTVYSSNQYCMGIAKGIELCQKDVNDAPTIDAEPVRHGRWDPVTESAWNIPVPVLQGWKCSLCGRTEQHKEPYCHCGAKMDGGVSDEG